MDPGVLRRIESIVNEQIKAELDVYAKETPLPEAKGINGLRAVFGEVSYISFSFLIFPFLIGSILYFLLRGSLIFALGSRSTLIQLGLCLLDKKLKNY